MELKGQLKIQQTAFMLLAIFLFFILAGMFYLIIQTRDAGKQAEIARQNDAIEMANMLASSPEFSCGSYCVDADRLMVLKNKRVYDKFWGVSSIEIRTIFPGSNQEKLCSEATYPDCNLFSIYKSGKGESTASSFIALCRRASENGYLQTKCELGEIIVGYSAK